MGVHLKKSKVKTQSKKPAAFFRALSKVQLFALILLFVFGSVITVAAATCSTKADCQAQIQNLNNKNSANQQALGGLQSQAQSYREAIDQLQGQIDTLAAQISANEAKQASLQKEIVQKQKEIDHNRAVLGEDIRAMYVDGQMTTIEQLATSNNLSELVDKEEYRMAVQNKITDIMAQITALQKQLEQQKLEVGRLLTNQKTQQSEMAAARRQQASLLAMNQSQQAAYNASIASNKKSISSLKSRLAALNTTSDSQILAGGTCGGGYPRSAVSTVTGRHWGCNYAQDNTLDNWNMYNRECVSYTAWMVYKTYHISTYGWGSAYKWKTAAASKYIVDQTPSAGAVAVRDRNWSDPDDVGHVMWVVSARSSSDITVWEYNQHMDGKFQERRFNPHNYSTEVYYIHFR